MRCPRCEHDEDKVAETRKRRKGLVIRRRRVCGRCQFVYYTVEQSEQYLKLMADAVNDGVSAMVGKNGDGK